MAIGYLISAFSLFFYKKYSLILSGFRWLYCKINYVQEFPLPVAQVLVSLCRLLDFPLWGYGYEIVIHLDSLLLGNHFVSIQRRKLLNRYEQNHLCEKNVHWKA